MTTRVRDIIIVTLFFCYVAAFWWLAFQIAESSAGMLPSTIEREVLFDGTEVETEMVEVIINEREECKNSGN